MLWICPRRLAPSSSSGPVPCVCQAGLQSVSGNWFCIWARLQSCRERPSLPSALAAVGLKSGPKGLWVINRCVRYIPFHHAPFYKLYIKYNTVINLSREFLQGCSFTRTIMGSGRFLTHLGAERLTRPAPTCEGRDFSSAAKAGPNSFNNF